MRVFRAVSRLAAFAFAAAIAIVLQAGASRAEIKKQFIDYKDSDKQLSGFLVYDDAQSGKRPGVLLGHDRAGMAAAAFRDSELIAKMGYVVFVADMFGKGFVPKDVPEMTATITIYNNDRPLMRSRAKAGFEVLKSNPMVDASKLAIVGYCFGGTVAIELAETGVPVAGTISVHGSFRNFAPEAAKNINGKVLILHGAEDPVAPIPEVMSVVEQLRAAKVNWELQLFSSTTHAFTDPKDAAEERADREYKVAMTRFLKEVFANGGVATR
jgi:dienelactone hydrolase